MCLHFFFRTSNNLEQELKKSMEPKKSENDLQWENLVRNLTRPLQLCDLDFTDLSVDDEKDIQAPRGGGMGIPPPPPPLTKNVANNNRNFDTTNYKFGQFGKTSSSQDISSTEIEHTNTLQVPRATDSSLQEIPAKPPPPLFGIFSNNQNFNRNPIQNSSSPNPEGSNSNFNTIKKNKKTVINHILSFYLIRKIYSVFSLQVKLFWKEVREDLIPAYGVKTIWDELPVANIDTQKLEHLFESRAKDLMTKVFFILYYCHEIVYFFLFGSHTITIINALFVIR